MSSLLAFQTILTTTECSNNMNTEHEILTLYSQKYNCTSSIENFQLFRQIHIKLYAKINISYITLIKKSEEYLPLLLLEPCMNLCTLETQHYDIIDGKTHNYCQRQLGYFQGWNPFLWIQLFYLLNFVLNMKTN